MKAGSDNNKITSDQTTAELLNPIRESEQCTVIKHLYNITVK
jgi:hypothetical protein